MKNRIVIIDDEIRLLRALKKALEINGHSVFEFSDPHKALDFISHRPPDLIVSDIRMPGMTGLEILEKLSVQGFNIPVILMTAYSSIETAIAAVKLGARDYLLKPFEMNEFKSTVSRVLEADDVKTAIDGSTPIIGSSKEIKSVLELVQKVAGTDSTVLIQGESGTGKELVARALHQGSARRDKPFVSVNCGAIPEQLFESELFGHAKGSFTGALFDKEGLFQEADGGTLFLDEIGDLAFPNQVKLLHVLQDGSFRRVGDVRMRKAGVRIISATNKDLRPAVAEGKFREDLLFRINVVQIALPALRQRIADIPELVVFFVERFCIKHKRELTDISPEFINCLQQYNWPGNVRELENVLERAVILKRCGTLLPEDISLPQASELAHVHTTLLTGAAGQNRRANQCMKTPDEQNDNTSLTDTIGSIEESLILQALAKTAWNYSKASSLLGITRQNLHYKLRKYGITGKK